MAIITNKFSLGDAVIGYEIEQRQVGSEQMIRGSKE